RALRLLGLVEVTALDRAGGRLVLGHHVDLGALGVAAPAEVAHDLHGAARVDRVLLGGALGGLAVDVQRPGGGVDAPRHVLEGVAAHGGRGPAEHQPEGLGDAGRHAGDAPLDDVHLVEAGAHRADDVGGPRLLPVADDAVEAADLVVGQPFHELAGVGGQL